MKGKRFLHWVVLVTMLFSLFAKPGMVTPVKADSTGSALQFNGSNQYVTFGDTRYKNGTLVNTPTWNIAANSKLGASSLTFNGSSQYVTTGAGTTFDSATFTVETWFYRTAAGTGVTTGNGGIQSAIPLLTKGTSEAENATADINYFLGIDTNSAKLVADFEEGVGGQSQSLNHPITGTTTIALNTWYHAAATYDGNKWQLFLNGNLENELLVGQPANAAGVSPLALATSIQSNGSTIQGYFAGRLDEARVWNYARTQAEIQASMNSEILTPTAGLLGRWGLNDASGTTASNLNRLGVTSFTLEAWVKRAAGGATMSTGSLGFDGTAPRPNAYPVLAKGMGEGETPANINTNWFLGITSTGMVGADFEDTAGGINHPAWGTTTVAIGEWHHIAATYNGSCWTLYVDGNPETLNSNVVVCPNATPESTSYQHAALSAGINSAGSLGAGYLSGVIDEARVWNRALSPAEILANKSLEISSGDSLVARWGMNENTGTVINSSVGTVSGILTNSPTWVTGFPPPDTTPPAAPTNLMASPRPASVQLEWTANTETDLMGYRIYRSTTSPVTTGTPINSTLQTTPSYLDEGLTSGTIYYYAVSAVDTFGNESMLSNEASAVPLPPLPPEALKLGSSNAYVPLGDKVDTATFTLETWLRRDGAGTAISTGTGGETLIPLITNGTAEAESAAADINYFFGIRGSDGVLCSDFEEAQTGSAPSQNHPVCGTTRLTTGTWYHAAATYDGTTWKLYLNGNLDKELAVGQPANAANTSQLAFGTSMTTANATSGYFNGTLDEVRIWNYARTQAQIVSTINTKITGAQTGLLGRWGMDEGSGSLAADSSGSNITGTISGSGYSWVPGSPFNATVNLPPVAPALVAPAAGATGVSTNPSLSVSVADPESQPLNVTFYGRPLQSAAGPDFTLVIIPDAQYYASSYPSIYNAQMNWVAGHRDSNNIVYVASLGDNVDSASTSAQWVNADAAYDILDTAGVPYGVAAGNHDGAPSGTANFNANFGTSRFTGKSYYGGHYETDNDNHYDLFEASGLKFIVVFIEYDDSMTSTNHPVLQWANNLLQTYSERRAIVISHNVLQGGTSTAFSTQGQAIYNALKGNPNLFMIMGGHLDVAARRTDTYNGSTVYTLRSDYQSVDSQQSGYLRILRFSPADDMVYVRTYSPTQNKDYDKSDAAQNNFTLPYTMEGVGFQTIGTASDVPSGSTATITWPGLANNSPYEWFVVASDGTHQTPSSTWSFATAPLNITPVCNDLPSVTTAEDTAASVTLSCVDANNDTLTYAILTGPAHGTLSGTAPNLTYTPAPNYNGPDSFTYKANDGAAGAGADSNEAAVSITITPVNDAPVCTPAPLTTAEDTPGSVTLVCTDVEGDPLTYSIVTGPSNGSATSTGAVLTYTPSANFFGSDSLSFMANDGAAGAGADSTVSALNITVTPVNDPPVCQDVSISTNAGTPGETTAHCSDIENDPLTYSIVSAPLHGTAVVDGSTLRYTPADNYSGSDDSFTYQASDGSLSSNAAGVAVTVIEVNTAPSITLQPMAVTVNEDETASFTTAATGNPAPTVQWQVSTDGSDWSNIPYATATTYSFTALAADNGSQYRAIFTNKAGTATTNAVTLTVNITPVITTQPADVTVTAGNTASFSATAGGRPTPTVKWQVSLDGDAWTDIPGATSTTYGFQALPGDEGKQFRAVFSNSAGSATSNAAHLTVNFAPVVTIQPANQAVTAGQTASFSAAASGNPTPGVQWQVSPDDSTWNDISDATSATYRFTAQAADNGHLYRAVFTNSVGSVESSAATLTVNYPPSAPTDLTAILAQGKQINLAWTDTSSNEANYEVERSADGSNGPFSPLVTLGPDTSAYQDTAPQYDSQYCYRVRAVNDTGSSDYTSVACATTGPEPNNALDFGMNHAYVSFGNAPALGLNQFTLETWFKREGTGTSVTTGTSGIEKAIPLLTKGTSDADQRDTRDMNYFLGIDADANVVTADFEEGATGTSPSLNHPVRGTTPIAYDTWYHVAVTYDGSKWQLFLNGQLEAESTVDQPPRSDSASPAALATSIKADSTAQGFFDGVLDEPRIWNYARTQAQIQSTINAQLTTAETGLVGRWNLNEGTGTIVHGSAGTTINGTISGSGYSWVAGAPFNVTFTPPDAPSGLSAAAAGQTINLAWTDNANNETAFQVERSVDGVGGPYTLLRTVAANTTAYTDAGLAYTKEYCYRVRATNPNGDSAYTDPTCATTGTEGALGLALGANNANVAFGDNADLSQFTLETWLKRDGAGAAISTGSGGVNLVPLITNGTAEAENSNADINYFLGIQSSNGALCADFEEAQTGTTPGLNHPVCGTTLLVNGTWYHAAATYDGATWRLYLNGNLEATLAVNQPANAANISQLAFGTSMTTANVTSGFFNGTLDEVRIWNYARTQAQVQGTINMQIRDAQAGLVARYGMNEGTGTTIVSSAGTVINGTIKGTGYSWVAGAPFDLSYNHAPDAPVLVSPATGATGIDMDVTLSVTASDPDNDPLTVTFYGRPATGGSGPDFTLVALPDTQNYTTLSGGDITFNAQTQWVVDRQAAENIVFTSHLGDITEGGDTNTTETQWTIADAAMSKLEKGTADPSDDIPFGLIVGNHDVNGGTTLFEKYFGVSRFNGRPYYGGHYGANNLNSYSIFNASGMSFIVLNLQCTNATPPTAVLDWADALLKADLNRRGIVVCHTLFASTSALSTEGTAVFNALSDNPNLFLMLGGHVPGVGRLTRQGADGHNIYLLLSDFQSETNGGNGWLRMMKFSPANNQIQVSTYSPTLNQYKTDAANQFTLDYAMQGSSFTQIGSANVASGETASVNWTGLSANAQYEWYVTVSDSQVTTNGPAWTFATINFSAPLVTGHPTSITVQAGEPATFNAAANGNPLPIVQWQSSLDGTTWNDISGATATTYSFTVQAGDNGKQFRAVFTNSQGTATTDTATLTVNFAPTVTTHPTDQTVNAGATATFSADASGNPTPTIQWQSSSDGGSTWSNISGATATIYSFTTQTGDNGKQFRAIFTNTLDTATTDAATLNLYSAPQITTQPIDQTVLAGQPVTFSAAASGYPVPVVQWQILGNNGKTWKNINGATAPDYTFTAQTNNNGKQFRAVFTNSAGAATSTVAVLTVIAGGTMPTITQQPSSLTVVAGQPASFSAAASGSPTPTVQWQVSADGFNWSDISGATAITYSFMAQISDNGKQFRAVFTNSYGSATTNAAVLTVTSGSGTAPVITQNPISQTVTSGQSVTFTAAASGSPIPTVQWYISTNGGKSWSAISGATNPSYTFTAKRNNNGSWYRAVFTNTFGTATTNAAILTIR